MNCRICLSDDRINDLFSPCKCSGSIKFVHRDCLDEWRKHNLNHSFLRCNTCKYYYSFEQDSRLSIFLMLKKPLCKLLSILYLNCFIYYFLNYNLLFENIQLYHYNKFPLLEYHPLISLFLFEIYLIGMYTLFKLKLTGLIIFLDTNLSLMIYSGIISGLISIYLEFEFYYRLTISSNQNLRVRSLI